MPVTSFISDINMISAAIGSGLAEIEFFKLAVNFDEPGELDVFLVMQGFLFCLEAVKLQFCGENDAANGRPAGICFADSLDLAPGNPN